VKRLLAMMLALVLVVTLVPPGLVRVANAAAATYFIPSISQLRNTATLDPLATSGATQLTRDRAFPASSGNLTITGTFAYVTADSMSVKIEQMNLKTSNNTWLVDDTHFTTGTVLADAGSSNKFTASNLTLFSGMNKITFTGKQGNIQRSDSFYVMYDQIPYLQSLKVTSGASLISLNEGAQVVVPNASVSLQGIAKNATKITTGINGGTQMVTTVYDDGSFFSPAMTLKAGLNTINMSVTNGSNTINIVRQLYYFDPLNPFTSVDLIRQEGTPTPSDKFYPLKDNVPTITVGQNNAGNANETASMKVQMLVPYESITFADHATYNISTASVSGAVYGTSVTGEVYGGTGGNMISEIIIPGPDGVTPQYRLVTFRLDSTLTSTSIAPFRLSKDATMNYLKNQRFILTVEYGTEFAASFDANFKYFPGETSIVNMEYLPGYNGTAAITADTDREPLNNAEIRLPDGPDFYILVKGSSTNNTALNALKGRFLPLSATTVTIGDAYSNNATNTPGRVISGLANDERIYKITAFPNGQQKVEFNLQDSSSTYIANISYISKSYIYIANLYDGQKYSFNSKLTNELDVIGQFIGFTSGVGNAQFFINGTDYDTFGLGDFATEVNSAGNFNLTLDIDDDGPLVFGENRLVFKGVNTIGGNTQEITKEIRIYIEDLNTSKIAKFMPTLDVNTRQPFVSSNLSTLAGGGYTPAEMDKIFSVTPEFLLKDGAYVTSQTSYDLVMRGGGAHILNLKLGSEIIHTKTLPPEGTPVLEPGLTFVHNGVTYTYDFAGDEKDFIFRVRSIPFATPGTHVYSLQLINSSGSPTEQSLEITREVSPYRVLSPQPTIGNQIIVNKNFVRFDIEAEGATEVMIGKEKATKRGDMNDRFVLDYVGLKPDKLNDIDIQIKRADSTLKDKIQVFYSSTVQLDSQFMEKIGTKHSVFNKGLQLTFPKGTVLQSVSLNGLLAPKLYTDTKLLFGIANPADGVVERRNDYGNIINVDFDARSTQGQSQIIIPDRIALRFANNTNTSNFTRISPIYWISGGMGEQGNRGDVGYKPATNGLAPYSIEGNFTEYDAGRKVKPSKRGSLTLSFDDSVVEAVSYTVTVFRYTDAGVWENVGGEVNAKARTITVPFDEFGYYQVVKLRKSYNDVTNHNWARNILNGLYSKGIMTNMRVDEFGANDQTTRGEFATLLVKGLDLPLKGEGNQTFFDITPGSRTATWDYEHIETAARAGIVNGLSEGFFGPDIRITREDAAVMIAKALQLKMGVNNSKLEANLAKAFVDSGSINLYARPAVEAVFKAKIMTGSSTTIPGQKKPLVSFNPKGYMTRAEAGKITVALLLKSTDIFPKNLS